MSDHEIRQEAFRLLEELTLSSEADVVTWSDLTGGLVVGGQRVPLIGAKGIWKPAVCELPISISTAPPKDGREPPYEDQVTPDGFLRYAYRGTDPRHPDNVGLRKLMTDQIPLIYFHGVAKGLYLAQWPVYVVEDQPNDLRVKVLLEAGWISAPIGLGATEEPEKRYRPQLVQSRLHQRAFRVRVLRAYREACAVCRLRHVPLLDAAHILDDSDPRSTPSTSNGLALCKIHHAAFD